MEAETVSETLECISELTWLIFREDFIALDRLVELVKNVFNQ
jgi:hypothetical protein